ncbi:DUF6509 family protein [Bacillus sp. SM2101]|uniref:DUF6509 family protein n=1 Tax=Bacillus sp. SM2101 TaxID=2805366 RepID=UPI001BDE68EE|nr:DUF6509 family protein [Bacillus sp. SM2101]
MNIISHSVEKLKDPTGILVGDRYEFFLHIEVAEDDDLFSPEGLYIKAIFAVYEDDYKVAQYQIIEKNTNKYYDWALDAEEEIQVLNYCKQNFE